MEPGQVVEYIDSQKIICSVILEIKNLRLRLLTENNREVKISAGRIAHRSASRLSTTLGRDKLVAELKEIVTHRRALSQQVDIQGMWEILNSEQQWIDLKTMTDFCFPDQVDDDHESAVLRAFFSDRLFFKFSPEQFFPHSAAKVEQILAQREKEKHQARLIDQGGLWLQKTSKGQSVTAPEDQDEIVQILASYCLLEKESPYREMARAIMKKAGASGPTAIFAFLVKIGIWEPDENLDLLRHDISDELPAQVHKYADQFSRSSFEIPPERRDLRDLPMMTIDGPATQDFDDALSITKEGDNHIVGIHIADVGHYITRNDPIDQDAFARGSSIYTPDQKISMLPSQLALGICSLKAGEDRPAISTMVTLSPRGKILKYDIFPSVIRVDQQLTYQDVDQMTGEDGALKQLLDVATRYHSDRLDRGAVIIDLPEINIWLDADGAPCFSRVDRESPAHIVVSELMILANDLAAGFLSERNLPAIFRSQAEPRERLFERDNGSLFQNWMQRKLISRFSLGSAPAPHSGLGLPAYVTCTSPIRKYSDLVTQRQVRAALGLEAAYTPEEMNFIIGALQEPIGIVGRIQTRRNRYWLLKYLEKRIGNKLEAIVLGKRREGFTILIPDYMIECFLSGADNVTLKPEDLVQVTIQHVNARNDVIHVYLG